MKNPTREGLRTAMLVPGDVGTQGFPKELPGDSVVTHQVTTVKD